MLTFDRVSKRYANGFLALDGVGFSVGESEIVGIVGGSGCGKSTLLRLAAGLDAPTGGQIRLRDRVVRGPQPEIGVVFQEPRLMPWLGIAENVTFGLRADGLARRERARELLDRVGLADFARALPRELSGGMAQRVAIARALAPRPRVLLLDEPFSALDAFTRLDLQQHLLDLWAAERPTLVLVTHDIEEALTLADRVVLMRGRPGSVHREIAVPFARPRARAAARFQALKEDVLAELNAALGRSAVPQPAAKIAALAAWRGLAA